MDAGPNRQETTVIARIIIRLSAVAPALLLLGTFGGGHKL
jgi:hypothetical protein